MNLTQIILGEVMTEKALRLKEKKIYVLKVHPAATKVDVQNALRQYFDVEPRAVRMLYVQPKERVVARGKTVRKRPASKRAIITLTEKSKSLDLTNFRT